MTQSEQDLQTMVADYIRIKYPDVIYHSDFGSGTKLTMGQAIRQKRQNGGRRAWPDMFIAEPRYVAETDDEWTDWGLEVQKNGLFLELKREGTRLKKKNGEWASDHIAEQAELLARLRDDDHRYEAQFACGFDEARTMIDRYLGGRK